MGIVTLAVARRVSNAPVLGSGLDPFLVLLVIATVGLICFRLSLRRSVEQEPPGVDDADAVEAQLDRLVSHLQNMNTNSENLEVQEISRVIDNQLAPDLNGCVASREALSRRWGLQSYADFMSRFAEGQRNIQQARQASAAGNVEEVWDNLGSAEARMIEACALLREYRARLEHPSHN